MSTTAESLRWLSIADIERYYVHLATGFAIGAITSSEFAGAMEAFKFRDDTRRYWTIGASSGLWYVHEGGRWRRAEPPVEMLGPDVPLAPVQSPDASTARASRPPVEEVPATPSAADRRERRCPTCGSPVPANQRFCTRDGTRVP